MPKRKLQSLQPTPSTTLKQSRVKKAQNHIAEEHLRELFSSKWLTIDKLKQIERETGLKYKRGRFSSTERHAINTAVEEYCRKEGIHRDIFLHALFNEVGRRRFAGFFVTTTARLAAGRPVLLVYHYMRRVLHPGNGAGKWTAEEDARLKQLFILHGPHWVQISKDMGRFGTACRDRYRKIREAYSQGPWTPEEVQRLRDAVQRLQQSRIEGDTEYLTWFHVSEAVASRSWVQCISKWTQLSAPKRAIPWTDLDDYQLCHQLYDRAYCDDSEVVWRDLLPAFPSISPDRLRNRWGMLKRRVANWRNVDMDTLLETLLANIRSPLTPDLVDEADE